MVGGWWWGVGGHLWEGSWVNFWCRWGWLGGRGGVAGCGLALLRYGSGGAEAIAGDVGAIAIGALRCICASSVVFGVMVSCAFYTTGLVKAVSLSMPITLALMALCNVVALLVGVYVYSDVEQVREIEDLSSLCAACEFDKVDGEGDSLKVNCLLKLVYIEDW